MGSTRKVEINLGETVKKTKVTPPSLIKATPTNNASNPDDVNSTSVSNADDVMLTSSSQNKEIHSNHSILPKKDPPEGKTTAIIAVMRGMVTTATAVTSTISKSSADPVRLRF